MNFDPLAFSPIKFPMENNLLVLRKVKFPSIIIVSLKAFDSTSLNSSDHYNYGHQIFGLFIARPGVNQHERYQVLQSGGPGDQTTSTDPR